MPSVLGNPSNPQTFGLTVKGSPISKTQTSAAETLLGVANSVGAGQIASEAIIYAAIGESELGASADTYTPNSAGYYGVLQGNAGTWPDPHDTTGMATAFFQGGKGFQSGGALALARHGVTDIAEIAVRVEVPSIWPANAYAQEGGWNDAQVRAECKSIVAAYGGAASKGGVAGAGGTGTVPDGSKSTTYQFQVGGTSNPDEDVWTAINRMASEVNWYLFSNGENLYYMDGPELLAQKPAVELDRINDGDRILRLSLAYDNTAYGYVSSHKRKFNLQRRTKVQPVTSPTQVSLDLICGIDEVRAGDLTVLKRFGPGDGRWIIGDCTRSVFATFSTLTLVPPIAPVSEAAAAGTTGSKQTNNSTGAGSTPLKGSPREKVVGVARRAIARQASQHAYQYQEVRPYPGSLFGPAPIVTDCSGFSILCYKDAGAPDPNGTNFDGSGNTSSLVGKGTPVQTPQPGDLIFYNTIGTNSHVAVYLGNDRIANMGSPNEPVEEAMNIAPIYGIRSYL